jgi:hypothetical protein
MNALQLLRYRLPSPISRDLWEPGGVAQPQLAYKPELWTSSWAGTEEEEGQVGKGMLGNVTAVPGVGVVGWKAREVEALGKDPWVKGCEPHPSPLPCIPQPS